MVLGPSTFVPSRAASARFLSVLPAISRAERIPALNARWANAYTAWQNVNETDGPPPPDAFLPATHGDRTFAAALGLRAQQHRNFRAFLAAPSDDQPQFIRTLRRQRIGYGILALHPEGPPLTDRYVVQENRVTAELAAGLFPAKGWLPGRFLLALLPENSR